MVSYSEAAFDHVELSPNKRTDSTHTTCNADVNADKL